MLKKRTARFAGIAVALGLLFPALSATAKDKVVIGELNWPGAVAIEHVLGEVISTRLGGDVSYLAGDLPVLLAAAAKNDGAVDVVPDVWLPNESAPWAKYVSGGTRSLVPNVHPYVGVQGFYIPGYIQDKYGVKSVYDLRKPEIAKLFVPVGGGKAQLLVGPAGWGSTYIGEVKAKDYGFANSFDSVSTEAAATYARLEAAYRQNRGIVFYAYTPDWIFSAFDLRRLDEPAFDGYAQDDKKGDPQYKADGCWKFINPTTDSDWLNKSHITCAYPDAKVYVLAARSLQTRSPKIAAFLSNVSFDPVALNELILKIQKNHEPADAAAKAWVAAHRSTVDAWLAGDAKPGNAK
ncbi:MULTISPECIES: glycine betaine ABC transporter substrate-binding protein [Paraburkholderia]|jgi:glycine betaine/proline transport system substrate-binding protein|uniref:ABC transporter substrate-binding protein n=1 Tax=Paraburkholderia hospita TaxID=169430 RepID=A0AAJ4STU0_9BURK|nr:glycine betaine ABC transporter substrate-binding protein [Paraburkholderia hospita]EUC16919.1 ABC-type glycine betaine transport, periplasmic subunit [Burkholderia sp. BT03]AUT74235.1 ABC transporter substrate-binding protein [Paraburkholderia hospita]EIN01202.1 glycine betaine ABC transporter substrate-binding protein [Paraburkholderia hospita]OUL79773.1 ABC transporter substrate-binding protein [Paraburkholderia hospita]OUL84518.1 ABC transporter substrate-binding protein [Paraburkholder